MQVFNTTYTVPNDEARNFVIWAKEVYIPRATLGNNLCNPRLLRVLTHKDQNTECFSLQFDVENTAKLHTWYRENGKLLNDEMIKMFKEHIAGFSTILEEI